MVRGERRTSGKTTAKAARPRRRSGRRAEAKGSAPDDTTGETPEASGAIQSRALDAEPSFPLSVTPEERRRMIESAAYARAERRGFVAGDPMDDWLQAESEVDSRLISEGRGSQRREPSA